MIWQGRWLLAKLEKAKMKVILCKHDISIRSGSDAIGNDRTVQIKSERNCRDWLVPLARTARQPLFLSVSGSPQKFITIMERLTQMKSWHLQPTFSNHNTLSSAILDLFLCQGAGEEKKSFTFSDQTSGVNFQKLKKHKLKQTNQPTNPTIHPSMINVFKTIVLCVTVFLKYLTF